MKKNVGNADRIVRIVLGIAIISFGIVYQTWWGAIGAGIIIPAVLRSDPLYSLIGVNINKG